ncbi:MAG: hypothetical protein KC593_16560, partial [Myxococcales bacterium]|nr:hypothetical protein [Myxococcales bacterium]
MSDKAWGGRFEEELNDVALRYSASVDVDSRLAPQDIRGSIAHVRMLAAQGIVPQADADAIVAGLEAIAVEIREGRFVWDNAREDVHRAGGAHGQDGQHAVDAGGGSLAGLTGEETHVGP